jgi:hypothetical protein
VNPAEPGAKSQDVAKAKGSDESGSGESGSKGSTDGMAQATDDDEGNADATGMTESAEKEEPEVDSEAPEDAKGKRAAAKPAGDGVLPNKAAEDDPRRWGDEPGYDHDQWLKEQKPPHWG